MLYLSLPIMKCRALCLDDDDANHSAYIVQRLSNEISSLLSKHHLNLARLKQGKPIANSILFRGCSRTPNLSDFDEYNNVQWNPMMMARTCIISGIGSGLGFNIIRSSDDPQDLETINTLLRDVDIFLNSLSDNRSCRFGFFHIKAVDEASHDYDFSHKITLIENIDGIIKLIIEKFTEQNALDEFHIVVTGDHTTLCRLGEHSCEPVPFLVSGPLSQSILNTSSKMCTRKLSECFIDNNMGRFSGKCIINFLKQILNK